MIVAPATANPDPGCATADAAAFMEIHTLGDVPGAAGWTLATGLVNDRIPSTPIALAIRGDDVCDLTAGFDAFVAQPKTEAEALETALFAVHAIYLDVFPNPVLLPSADIGFPAEKATVTRTADGYVVDFTAWSDFRGHVAEFRAVFDGETTLTFEVLANTVGPFGDEETHGWLLYPGDTQAILTDGLASLDGFTKVMIGTMSDGKKFRVTYHTGRYAESEPTADFYADMHLVGMMQAYETLTGWGFVSMDPDGILDLTLDGCDCIYGQEDANIHMFPRPNDILPLLPGLSYPNGEFTVGRLISGHELFHHMQYGIQRWRLGNWMTEGQARFSETVHVPDDTFAPSTLVFWPNINGINGYLAQPNLGIGSHMYDFAIVWGTLYKHDGGMAVIKKALQESATGGTSPDKDGPAIIDRAIAAMPTHRHGSYKEMLNEMAVKTITHDPDFWTWGKTDGTSQHDWSTYFNPTRTETPTQVVPGVHRHQSTVKLNGFQCVKATPGASGTIAAAAQVDTESQAFLVTRSGTTWNSAPLLPAAVAENANAGTVCVARAAVAGQAAGNGAYTLAVASP